MNDIILYHGSRGGIDGNIQPISRARCDFGKGFYMGENQEQVKGLIAEAEIPMFYVLNFKLSEIPEDKILVLDGMDWVYTVLAHRKRVSTFNELPVAQEWLEEIKKYDVIIGPIADDRMNIAMQEYSNENLTDMGLLECLKYVNYGRQFVARTDFACSKIDIMIERSMSEEEIKEITLFSSIKRQESKDIVDRSKIKNRHNGLYLDELISLQYEKETISREIGEMER